MKKIIITGANGFVGSRLSFFLERMFDVTKTTRNSFDITDEKNVLDYVENIKPDYVIHCAAHSDIGYCHKNPDESYKVNVLGTRNIAAACKKTNSKMIFFSSDQVYNGSTTMEDNFENDELNPKSIYAKHKLKAENCINDILDNYVILRSTWLYDLPQRHCKYNINLPLLILKSYIDNEILHFPDNEFRGITYLGQIIENFPKILDIPTGIYNLGSENELSSYEAAVALANALKLKNIDKHILSTEKVFTECSNNLKISNKALRDNGVELGTTLDGFNKFVSDFSL